MVGKLRRLRSLELLPGRFALLALDHGLTFGSHSGFSDLRRWLEFAAGHCSGAIVNAGRLAEVSPTEPPLIAQLMGLPCVGSLAGRSKVPLTSVQHAVDHGAAAVSVQFKVSAEDGYRVVGQIMNDAARLSVPVLMMINSDSTSEEEPGSAIRFMAELGADLIKIGLRDTLSPETQARLRETLAFAPPCLLAGGPIGQGDLMANLRTALALGFAGYCVGRHIFQSSNPTGLIADMNASVISSRSNPAAPG